MPRVPDDPGTFPPDERIAVLTLATSKTDEHDRPATRWSLDELAATLVNEAHHRTMSRATIWRILDEAPLSPAHPPDALGRQTELDGDAGIFKIAEQLDPFALPGPLRPVALLVDGIFLVVGAHPVVSDRANRRIAGRHAASCDRLRV
jgi:hypothetical protein